MFVRNRFQTSFPSPSRTVALAFLAAVAVGAILLSLPFCHLPEARAAAVQAATPFRNLVRTVFLATSAICVTGLDPIGIQGLSTAGLVVLTVLVQLGGIGIMTVGTFVFLAAGRSLSVSEERSVMASTGETKPHDVGTILRSTFAFTLAWETMGTILLAARIAALNPDYGFFRALGHGAFYAIMSFCNAGFNPFPEGADLAADPLLALPVCALAIVGGIGFIVHANLLSLRPWRRDRARRGRLSLHSRIVLEGLFVVLALDLLVFLGLEWNHSFAQFGGTWNRLVAGLFQGVTTRSTGFDGVPPTGLTPAAQLFTLVMMFVGAAPGSTGGGVKTTTLWVLGATVVAMFRSRQCPELHGRTVPRHVVNEAVAVLTMYLGIAGLTTFGLFVTESPTAANAGSILFEAVSAFCNNGLEFQGTTQALSPAGQIVLTLAMFAGRVGPVALVLTLFRPHVADRSKRFPEENIIVG